MSRSYRHHAIIGVACCRSEKRWKRYLNRAIRKRRRQLIAVTPVEDLEDLAFPCRRQLDSWGPKDGKQQLARPRERDDEPAQARWRKWLRK